MALGEVSFTPMNSPRDVAVVRHDSTIIAIDLSTGSLRLRPTVEKAAITDKPAVWVRDAQHPPFFSGGRVVTGRRKRRSLAVVWCYHQP